MEKIKCKCGCTYFTELRVNEFISFPTNLSTGMREANIDDFVKVYSCLSCGEKILPPISYHNINEQEQELYKKLLKIIDGKVPEEPLLKRKRPIMPGQVGVINETPEARAENHGKFVRIN